MAFNPEIHHRRSIRLPEYDYSSAGAYFVTVCVQGRECLFGGIVDGAIILNKAGRAVEDWWAKLPEKFPGVELDEFIIMPNHVHGIIVIMGSVGAPLAAPDSGSNPENRGAASSAPTLGKIVRAFKSVSAVSVNRIAERQGQPLWQRNYYERVIRSEDELNRARKYIAENPLKWAGDEENPGNA